MNEQKVICGNNIDILKSYPDNYFDAIVTDPPYGLGNEPNAEKMLQAWLTSGYLEVNGGGFMGKEWDAFVPQPIFWKEVFRVLKFGGYVLAFFGTRTYDWGVMAMRLAGFEVRDSIQWVYGSGFPKSHNISKAIDKKPNLEFIKEWKKWLGLQIKKSKINQAEINKICGFNAVGYARWDSNDYWATNLPTKEKYEKIKQVVGIYTNEWDFICDNNLEERGFIEPTGGLAGGSGFSVGCFSGKQLSDNSISPQAKQWEGWGSALKPAVEPIVVCRKPLEKGLSIAENVLKWGVGGINIDGCRVGEEVAKEYTSQDTQGRFPANIILECICDELIKGERGEIIEHNGSGGIWNEGTKEPVGRTYNDKGDIHTNPDCPCYIMDRQSGGNASRFFYQAKASKSERNRGLEGFANFHPTIKPVKLMQYLVRLVTPPNGLVLDPFCGSGTTGIACRLEGFNFVGMEREEEYAKIAQARIENFVEEEEIKTEAKKEGNDTQNPKQLTFDF